MKYCQKIYPKGTFYKQQTDGAYINQLLADNLDLFAKKIGDDMHFLIIIAGNDSVGNGKSTLMTHIGTYLTNKINEIHKVNNSFTHKNVVFRGKDLQTISFELPKYSIIALDEGDDLTDRYWSAGVIELKKYFRKCRQLNQILILILPSFFEMPRFWALARSHCLINVKFHGEFERGFFDFYSPEAKKKLYLKGKKEWNYYASKPDFQGRFFGSYTFFPDLNKEVELYKKNKYNDMTERKKPELTQHQMELEIKKKLFLNIKEQYPDWYNTDIAKMCMVNEKTIRRWLKRIDEFKEEFDNT